VLSAQPLFTWTEVEVTPQVHYSWEPRQVLACEQMLRSPNGTNCKVVLRSVPQELSCRSQPSCRPSSPAAAGCRLDWTSHNLLLLLARNTSLALRDGPPSTAPHKTGCTSTGSSTGSGVWVGRGVQPRGEDLPDENVSTEQSPGHLTTAWYHRARMMVWQRCRRAMLSGGLVEDAPAIARPI
jgi:hypothetical protein